MVPVMFQHVEHRTLLGKVGEGVVVAASVYHSPENQKGERQSQRPAVSTPNDIDR